jgi:hypothetical protein
LLFSRLFSLPTPRPNSNNANHFRDIVAQLTSVPRGKKALAEENANDDEDEESVKSEDAAAELAAQQGPLAEIKVFFFFF